MAVPALIRALQENDWYMQGVVSDALAEFGSDAKSAVQQLIKTIENGEGTAKVNAANALWRIQGKDESSIAEIAIERYPDSGGQR